MSCGRCTLGLDDRHLWSEPEDEQFADSQLRLRRRHCECPVCAHCPAVTVAVAGTARWYGQHRSA